MKVADATAESTPSVAQVFFVRGARSHVGVAGLAELPGGIVAGPSPFPFHGTQEGAIYLLSKEVHILGPMRFVAVQATQDIVPEVVFIGGFLVAVIAAVLGGPPMAVPVGAPIDGIQVVFSLGAVYRLTMTV